ncbi:ABC transporter permease [Adhaeribacter swui]|uniref:ABC transporter permease n=1 Tax=Adhaeribacter swui TaxID=2086471 RepID=A0A7G7G6R4_9BACT|nr:ABC transporter permease [Adhaeribacter swui]QNF32848.1 ABC transporter permease [Adhaeribacter swui]
MQYIHFKIALRNLRRHQVFSLINVLGLAIGISASLLIFLITQHELSYDQLPDKDRVYRVVLDLKFNGEAGHSAGVPAPLSQTIPVEVTGVELTVPIMHFQGDATAKVTIHPGSTGQAKILKKQAGIIFTNQQYFSLLPYQWLAGSPATALQQPFRVVLTQSRAQQYFPTLNLADIIGKTLRYNSDFTATVAGIVQDLPQNTTLDAVEFISFPTIAETHLQENFMMNVWNDWMAYSQVYVKLAPNNPAAPVAKQLNALLNKYHPNANRQPGNALRFALQPLPDVHFNQDYAGFNQRVAQKFILYGLLAVAAFLLTLACINFINLTTANSAQRAKEIGIRKTMGSSRQQLITQFLTETLVLTSLAGLLSFGLAPVLLQLFADFLPPGLQSGALWQPGVFLFLAGLTLLVSFLAGWYPALVLSGYEPVKVLKAQATVTGAQTRQVWIRQTLTVSQFVIAQVFVVATLLVGKQLNYAVHTELGFTKEGVLTFNLPRNNGINHRQQMLNEINALPTVEVASTGFLAPIEEGPAFTQITYAPKPELKDPVQIRWGDPNYLQVYQIKLRAGRNVRASDSITEFLINETYARRLGFKNPEAAIGQSLIFNDKKLPIVGVVQDFHAESMHRPITPVVLGNNNGDIFHVRLKPNLPGTDNWQQAIAGMQQIYQRIYPGEDFDYRFVDDAVASFYQTEQRTAKLLNWATGLSLLISCLGLLGLAMYTIQARTKEIGIRKVLGASVNSITALLSRDFLKLVLLANLLAWPVAWYGLHHWLQNFTYRIAIGWEVFALAGAATLLVTLLTVSFQAIKAAVANPVNALRNE